MERLSGSPRNIKSDIRNLPMIWRVTFYIALAILAVFLKYLIEAFHVPNNSWTIILIGTIYVLVIFGVILEALHFLRRRLSN